MYIFKKIIEFILNLIFNAIKVVTLSAGVIYFINVFIPT